MFGALLMICRALFMMEPLSDASQPCLLSMHQHMNTHMQDSFADMQGSFHTRILEYLFFGLARSAVVIAVKHIQDSVVDI